MYYPNIEHWTFEVENNGLVFLFVAWYKYIFVYEFCLGYFIRTQYMIYQSKSDIDAKQLLEKV
jgi:hypothetical protein